MSVDQTTPRRAARSPEQARLVKYHDYIDEKIESTRRLVKVVDLATALVGMAVVLLLFLAAVVVAEHWLVRGGLSSVARWVLFAGVVAYVGQFAYRKLWPLVSQAINPVYAAQAIEQGAPTLKNSLINLLSFRQKRTDVSDAVYRTLEEQAAQGLTRVQVDASVDQSNLIRLGYALITIVAIAALYKIFSPKDPFVTAERVLVPWAHVVPASRVQISEIKPGTTTVSVGESIDVSAEVRGLRDDESVALRYTTDDGQTVNRAVAMKGSSDSPKFSCRLSEGGDFSTGSGVTRSLTYWLEAGDARSLTYPVTVVTAASILVERVDYQYPKYTGLVDRSVDAIGDIRAIEGTRVTVHARANGAIREAAVDFDADGRRDLSMTTAENQAQAGFELQLRDDRETPRHASYVLRFTNDEGRANIDPVKHAINVERDMSPEVEIRSPQEKTRDVRADENVAIEVNAADPDYKLAAVRLKGLVAEQETLNESLLKSEEGRFTGRFAFRPTDRGLKAGDVLEYWIEADDNRTPKPNTTASERRSLRIVSPDSAKQPPPDRIARSDRQPQDGQQPKDQQQQDGQQEKGQQPGQNQQGGGKQGQSDGKTQDNAAGGEGQPSKDKNDEQSKGQGQEQGGGGNSSKPNDAGGQSQDGKSGDQQGQPGGQSQKQDSGEQKNDASQNGGQGKGEQQAKGSPSDSSKQNPANTGDKQNGVGTADGESSKDGAQSAGTRPDQAKQDKDKQGETGRGGDKEQESGKGQSEQKRDGASGEQNAPVSSEGDNDAEAFNRIQKHLEQNGELKPEGNKKEGQSNKEQGKQGESKGQQQNGSKTGEQQPQQSGAKSEQRGEKADKQQPGEGEKEKQEASGDQEKQEKSPGGQETTSKGSPGGGNEEKPQGSPNSEQQRKPTDKPEQSPSKGEKSDKSEPPAGSNSKKESDSHGDQGGDKSGGGEEGSGQKAQRDGTGSAGQNQSADEGAGQSGEKGKGANSSDGGKDAKSDTQTGSTDGKTQGKGSQQREGTGDKPDQSNSGNAPNREQNSASREAKPSADGQQKPDTQQPGKQDDQTGKAAGEQKRDGNKEQGKAGEKSENKNGDQQPGNQDKGQKPPQPQTGSDESLNGQQGESVGGGKPGGGNPSPSITGEAEKGDEANLEYARKQTDLVVNKLADQLNRKKVDEQLLKELGWSEADMKKFVERWQQRKLAAERADDKGETAKRELEEALRSLGLQRGDLQQNAAQRDTMRDLKEGYRGPVPDRYKERLKAYNQGVSRAKRDGE